MIQQINVVIMVAISKNGRIIGNSKTNALPGWNLTDDRIHMSTLTSGHTTFMGKNTFKSFPVRYRPLPNRDNLIITRQDSYVPYPTNDDTHVCASLEDALLLAKDLAATTNKTIYCFGGGQIYSQVLKHPMVHVTKFIITEVEGEFEGDVVFPEIDVTLFRETSVIPYEKIEKRNSHDFTIHTYERIA
jgi:dihydrofolate reductase